MPTNASQLMMAEVAKLAPSALVELFVLDVGGTPLYFYDGTTQLSAPNAPNPLISYQGQAYQAMPIQVKGFEFRSKGELPHPTITFSNVMGIFTSLTLMFQDLVGAQLTRKRTFRAFLDDGVSPAQPGDSGIPDDIYFISQKTSENKQIVQFELGTSLDVEGLILPRRQVVSNICSWGYRSPECGVADLRFVADFNGLSYPRGEFPLGAGNMRYRGYYVHDAVYTNGDCVSVTIPARTDEYVYRLSPSVSSSHQIDPGNPSYPNQWTQIQHYRGLWDTHAEYIKNDVVYIVARTVGTFEFKQFFIAILDGQKLTGDFYKPPNLTYWAADQCAKALSSCKLRQDSTGLNKKLTFGAFPGTSRTPQV